MARTRRDVFRNIKGVPEETGERPASSGYAIRGASRNMLSSINELAAKAQHVGEGDAIVELATDLLDASFVSDRMNDDDGFAVFVEEIRAHGQDTPILVRPHPSSEGRYQIVFGHRRARACRELGKPVRAIVRAFSDIDHVISQGQENSARANLSFIERALFAQRLSDHGYDRAVILAALSVDAPMLTRMLSVSSRIPELVAQAIGPARNVGRDRWIDFAQLIEQPSLQSEALLLINDAAFSSLASDERFERAYRELKRRSKPVRASVEKPQKSKWQPNKDVSAELVDTGKTYSIAFRAKVGPAFGKFVAGNLDRFYAEFLSSTE